MTRAARRQAGRRRGFATRALAAVVVLLVLPLVLVATAGPASAQGQPGAAGPFSCRVTTVVDGQPVDHALLPLGRWGDAAAGGVHTRLDPGTLGLGELENRTVRGTFVGGALSVGNSLWEGTASLLEFATTMRVLDSAGCATDRAAAAVGRSILDSGLLTAFVVVLLVAVAWRAFRHGGATGSWAAFGRAALVVALFAIMLAGAMRTTGPRNLGAGSPAWIVTNLEDVVASVASVPAQALDTSVAGSSLLAPTATGDAMHCGRYVAELRERYRANVGSRAFARGQASVPLVVSSMWERSGLQIYADAQFGPANPYGEQVACRLLERRAQVPVDEQRILTAAASGAGAGMVGGSADVVFVGSDSLTTDRVVVAWASCDFAGGSWRADAQWREVEDREPVTNYACGTLFWTEGDVGATQYDDPQNGQQASPFEFAETPEQLPQQVLDPEVQSFLLNFHGHAVMGGLTVSGVYVLVSLVVAGVFGLLALGIVVAKIALVALAVMSFVALLLALLPNTGTDRLARYARMTLGVLMFALVAQLLLALVLVLTDLVARAGFAVFDGASVEGVLWLGFAPLAAVITLHLVITRGLGAPSPFVPSAAVAYGRAFASGAVTTRGFERLMSFARSRGGTTEPGGGRVDVASQPDDDAVDTTPASRRAPVGHGANPQSMAARELGDTTDGRPDPDAGGPGPRDDRSWTARITPGRRRGRGDRTGARGRARTGDRDDGSPDAQHPDRSVARPGSTSHRLVPDDVERAAPDEPEVALPDATGRAAGSGDGDRTAPAGRSANGSGPSGSGAGRGESGADKSADQRGVDRPSPPVDDPP